METQIQQGRAITIKIHGKRDMICRSSWIVEEALNIIRRMYNLKGEILINDEFLLPNRTFEEQLLGRSGILSFICAEPCENFEVSTIPSEISPSQKKKKKKSLDDYEISPTNKQIYLPSYKRYQFTPSPAFGDEFIVGNLNSVVESIEEHILQSMNSGNNYKENCPFHCIINPPRHGKSLLLDCLFKNNENIIVIGITYNSTTGLVEGETNNSKTAIKWFWIRVLKSILQIPGELDTLSNYLPNLDDFSWNDIKSLIINGLSSNPFIDSNGNEKSILFCIDEFSVITDKLKIEWEEDKQKQFISKLHRIKQSTYPFIQFVMTGFHVSMRHLLSSSSMINHYTLQMCDFSTSRPLLRKILEKYNSTQSGDFIPFPLTLFEVVKSTPGLIGYWAELLVDRKVYCHNIFDFTQKSTWFENLTQVKENGGPLKSNWLLIFNFLVYLIQENSSGLCSISDEIVASEIGISINQLPDIIPLCFVHISSQAHIHKMGESLLQNIILEDLFNLFKTFETIDPNNEKKDGSQFEMLTITALHIRLLLWVQIQYGDYTPEQIVQIPFRSFLPIPDSESFSCYHPQLQSKFSVHLIRSKESLRKLLIPPLYNIFPLGIKSLEDNWDQETQSSLLALIDSKKYEYQFYPLEDNPTINISSKSPPKINQSIICKVKNYIIDNNLVFQLFNRMKSGELYEEINQALIGNDQTWWKKVKELIVQLQTSIEKNHSLISTANGAEGVDLLIVWKQNTFNLNDDDNVKINQEIIHIAALELKDQRKTPLEEWEKKWNSLMSPLCILHWIPLFYPNYKFSIHFMFAGREHSS